MMNIWDREGGDCQEGGQVCVSFLCGFQFFFENA